MALKNVFTTEVAEELINRINRLTPESRPSWGKMSIAQMLAHCNVTYELVYDNKHPKPGFFMKLMLKSFVKGKVISEEPYKQNSPTAPVFIVKDDKNFEIEKQRLIDHIRKTQQLGEVHFEGKVSHSFGPLKKTEWNNMFYKHLEHHLTQFGV